MEFTLTQKIRPQLVELADIFDHPASNQTALSLLFVALNTVQGNVTLATNAASDIRRPLMGISMSGFLNVSSLVEKDFFLLFEMIVNVFFLERRSI